MPWTDTTLLFLTSLQFMSMDTAYKGSFVNLTNIFCYFPPFLSVPRGSRQYKSRQVADNDGREKARLLEISWNNATLPSDWKKAIVVPIYKGDDRSTFTNYRSISLPTVVCKQLEHVLAGYLRQVWDKNAWLYEGQHGFRAGYCCESQVISVCQDIADCLHEGSV